jgi:hypothetical protein
MPPAAKSGHAAWLAARQPAPHGRIVARVEQVLGADASLAARPLADALLAAADALLASALSERAGAARETALDLLSADACVTWAFEAAANEPQTIDARATEAIRRFTEAAA